MKYLYDIVLEDLEAIQTDLKTNDKVSLFFLLSGCYKDTDYLQKSLNNGSALKEWAKQMDYYGFSWRLLLLESLCIIQVFGILEKLGIQTDDAAQNILIANNGVHPILKLLYTIAEEMGEKDKLAFVTFLERLGKNVQAKFDSIELIFFELIAEGSLEIGRKHKKCNLTLILDFLARTESMLHLFASTKDAQNRFNTRLAQGTLRPIVFPTSSLKAMQQQPTAQSTERYNVRRATVGKVLIINQVQFTPNPSYPDLHLEERRGSDFDCEKLDRVFKSFGFEVVVERDLECVEIERGIKKFVQKIDNDDSVFVCILSHGQSGTVYGSDSKLLAIGDIKNLMAAENLKNKPKVLLVQACQGTSCLQKHDDDIQRDSDVISLDGTRKVNKAVNLTDFLVMQATIDGFAALRDPKMGTWFIESFVECLDRLGDTEHLLAIATATTREVTKRVHLNMAMVPVVNTTLTRDFYLPNRTNSS